MTAQRRVQAPEIRGPAPFRPTPIQSSTYVRPAEQSGVGDNLARLADALSPLNSALVRFGTQAIQQQQAGQPATVQAKYGTMPFAEFSAKLGRGEIPEANQEAFGALAGARFADEWNREIGAWTSSPEYDGTTAGLQAKMDQRRQEIMTTLPSEAAKAIFSRASQPFYERYLQGGVKREAEAAAGQLDTNVMSQYRLIVEDGIAKGLDANAIAGAVVAAGKANRNILKLPGPRQNALLFDVAREYALQGRPDIVKAILEHDRDGVGPLGKTADYSVKGLQLVEAAQGVADKESRARNFDVMAEINAKAADGSLTKKDVDTYRAANPWLGEGFMLANLDQANRVRASTAEAAAKAEAERAMKEDAALQEDTVYAQDYASSLSTGGGGLDRLADIEVPDGRGGTRVLSGQKRRDNAVQRRLAESKASLSAGTDPRVQFEADLQWFSANKVANPEWAAKLEGVQAAASAAVVAKGQLPASVAGAADLYLDLHAKNPAYAEMVVKDARSEEFFETYRLFRQDGHSAEAAAFMTSSVMVSSKNALTPRISVEELEKKVSASLGTFWSGFYPTGMDIGTIRQRIRLYQMSRSPERAIDEAIDWFKNTHTLINGRAVYTAGSGTPSDFGVLVPELLDQYVGLYGAKAGVTDASTLSVVPMTTSGQGVWMIIDANTGMPVPNLADGLIDTAELAKLRDAKRAAAAGKVIKQWEARPDQLSGFNSGPVNGDFRRAEAERFHAERDKRVREEAGTDPRDRQPEQGMRLPRPDGSPRWEIVPSEPVPAPAAPTIRPDVASGWSPALPPQPDR